MNDIDLLSHIYQTAEMGWYGIGTVIPRSKDPKLTRALTCQAEEYRRIQDAAGEMLRDKGVQPEGTGAMAKLSARVMGRMKTMLDHSSAKIAEMMIQGSAKGVTKSLRTMRNCGIKDERARDLADKLLKTEQANIEEMKRFL